MYKHVLLPTDGSELSAKAVRDGIQLAKEIGARVTAVHVTPPFYPSEMSPSALTAHAQEHEAQSRESAKRALGAVEEAARAASATAPSARFALSLEVASCSCAWAVSAEGDISDG